MCAHMKEFFAIMDSVLEMSAKTRVRALVFSQFGRKQKVKNDTCDRIFHRGNSLQMMSALLSLHLEMHRSLCEMKCRDLRKPWKGGW